MGVLARLVAAVTGAVAQMNVGDVEQLGERLTVDHPLPAGRLLGAAARNRLAQHDATVDEIASHFDTNPNAPDLADMELDG